MRNLSSNTKFASQITRKNDNDIRNVKDNVSVIVNGNIHSPVPSLMPFTNLFSSLWTSTSLIGRTKSKTYNRQRWIINQDLEDKKLKLSFLNIVL